MLIFFSKGAGIDIEKIKQILDYYCMERHAKIKIKCPCHTEI